MGARLHGVRVGRRDCLKMCDKLSFIDGITGLTGYEYDNILSILSKDTACILFRNISHAQMPRRRRALNMMEKMSETIMLLITN